MQLSIIILLSVIIITLIALAIQFKEFHPSLHIIFLFSSFSVIILSLNIVRNIIETEGFDINITPLLFVLSIITSVVLIFYLIIFIKGLIEKDITKNEELGLEKL